MKITKFGFEEFAVTSEDLVMREEEFEEEFVEAQDNDNDPLDVPEDTTTESSQSNEEIYKAAYDAAKLDVERQMMDQNKELESTLSDIRKLIVDIEKQQDTRFSELYKSMASFLHSILKKIISNAQYATIISDTIMGYVSDIISKIKGSSLLSIRIPQSMSDSVKEKVSGMLTSLSEDIKVDIKEHPEDAIKMEWSDGAAEIEVEAPMKKLDDEMKKLDLIG